MYVIHVTSYNVKVFSIFKIETALQCPYFYCKLVTYTHNRNYE